MDDFDIMMTALRFNEKINQRDLDGLVTLMSEDYKYVDNSEDIYKNMEVGWKQFFENHLDYRNIFIL